MFNTRINSKNWNRIGTELDSKLSRVLADSHLYYTNRTKNLTGFPKDPKGSYISRTKTIKKTKTIINRTDARVDSVVLLPYLPKTEKN